MPLGSVFSVVPTSQQVGFSAVAFSGATGGVDATNSTQGGPAGSLSISTGALAQASEIVFASLETNLGGGIFTEDSNFTTINPGDEVADAVSWAYSIVSSTASVTYAPSFNTDYYGVVIASFKATSAGPAGPSMVFNRVITVPITGTVQVTIP